MGVGAGGAGGQGPVQGPRVRTVSTPRAEREKGQLPAFYRYRTPGLADAARELEASARRAGRARGRPRARPGRLQGGCALSTQGHHPQGSKTLTSVWKTIQPRTPLFSILQSWTLSGQPWCSWVACRGLNKVKVERVARASAASLTPLGCGGSWPCSLLSHLSWESETLAAKTGLTLKGTVSRTPPCCGDLLQSPHSAPGRLSSQLEKVRSAQGRPQGTRVRWGVGRAGAEGSQQEEPMTEGGPGGAPPLWGPLFLQPKCLPAPQAWQLAGWPGCGDCPLHSVLLKDTCPGGASPASQLHPTGRVTSWGACSLPLTSGSALDRTSQGQWRAPVLPTRPWVKGQPSHASRGPGLSSSPNQGSLTLQMEMREQSPLSPAPDPRTAPTAVTVAFTYARRTPPPHSTAGVQPQCWHCCGHTATRMTQVPEWGPCVRGNGEPPPKLWGEGSLEPEAEAMPPGQTTHIQPGVPSALAALKAAPTPGFKGTCCGASVDSSEGPGVGAGGGRVGAAGASCCVSVPPAEVPAHSSRLGPVLLGLNTKAGRRRASCLSLQGN